MQLIVEQGFGHTLVTFWGSVVIRWLNPVFHGLILQGSALPGREDPSLEPLLDSKGKADLFPASFRVGLPGRI